MSTPPPLQSRHNERDVVLNHRRLHCLLNCLFMPRSRKHQSSPLLAFVRGIHRWPGNPLHKGPVTRKTFPFDDVIIHPISTSILSSWRHGMDNTFRITGPLGWAPVTGRKEPIMRSIDVLYQAERAVDEIGRVADYLIHLNATIYIKSRFKNNKYITRKIKSATNLFCSYCSHVL